MSWKALGSRTIGHKTLNSKHKKAAVNIVGVAKIEIPFSLELLGVKIFTPIHIKKFCSNLSKSVSGCSKSLRPIYSIKKCVTLHLK